MGMDSVLYESLYHFNTDDSRIRDGCIRVLHKEKNEIRNDHLYNKI